MGGLPSISVIDSMHERSLFHLQDNFVKQIKKTNYINMFKFCIRYIFCYSQIQSLLRSPNVRDCLHEVKISHAKLAVTQYCGLCGWKIKNQACQNILCWTIATFIEYFTFSDFLTVISHHKLIRRLSTMYKCLNATLRLNPCKARQPTVD